MKFSYSQEGEDVVLDEYFANKSNGFYVDIGAHHPKRFSNTYRYYRKGWRGINIDATPGSMRIFNILRARDINLESGVGEIEEEKDFYVFNEKAVNSFDKELSLSRVGHDQWRIEKVIKVPIRRLENILSENLPPGTTIDFMSVDVEGHDMAVLKSNDWNRFRPKIILVETYQAQFLEDIFKDAIYLYLKEKGYSVYCKTPRNLIFMENKNLIA